jgi:hypothetical protein
MPNWLNLHFAVLSVAEWCTLKRAIRKVKNTIRENFWSGSTAYVLSRDCLVQRKQTKSSNKLVLCIRIKITDILYLESYCDNLFLQEQKPPSISWLYGRRHNCSRKHSQSYFTIIILVLTKIQLCFYTGNNEFIRLAEIDASNCELLKKNHRRFECHLVLRWIKN